MIFVPRWSWSLLLHCWSTQINPHLNFEDWTDCKFEERTTKAAWAKSGGLLNIWPSSNFHFSLSLFTVKYLTVIKLSLSTVKYLTSIKLLLFISDNAISDRHHLPTLITFNCWHCGENFINAPVNENIYSRANLHSAFLWGTMGGEGWVT